MKSVFKRLKAILTALMYVAVYDAVSLVIQLGFILWKKGTTGESINAIFDHMTDDSYPLMVISMIVAFWIFLLVGKLRKKPIHTFVHEEKYPFMVYVMSAALAVGTRMVVAAYYYFSQGVEPLRQSLEKAAEFSPSLGTPSAVMIAVFATVIIAPIFEETLFRGVVMGELLTIMRPWAAITLSGIIFGVAHGVLFQSVFATFVGILLGIIYYKTKDIKTAIVCHGVFNYSVVLTTLTTDFAIATIFAIFGILLVGLSMVYIIKNRR